VSRTNRKHSRLRVFLGYPDWKPRHEWTTLDNDSSIYNQYQKYHMKRFARRNQRREGAEIVRNWEQQYTFNQHLEPFNWVLDEEYGMFDLIQDMQDEEEWDWECESYNDWHVEPYDYYEEDLFYDDYYD
jgi:hypothetical protein